MRIRGAAATHPDHAIRALSAAKLMIETLKKWNEGRVAEGEIPLEMGIGIHTGIVVAGNMGAEDRLNYTVIGSNVNLTEMMVTNCQRMDTLVKNLLALAAVDESLPLARLEECNLVDLAQQAKQSIHAIHPSAKIDIEKKGIEPFVLMADSDLLLQALLNLLDNGVKYSESPAQLSLILEKNPQEMIIHVFDKGMGIPAEDLDHIFDRFYAVNKTRSRSLGGSGLGLSIVERIVEKQGGKISVVSTFGKGTTFTLTFPI